MKKGESMQQTVKWILVLLIAIKVGTFVMERLYDLHINVWLARGAAPFIENYTVLRFSIPAKIFGTLSKIFNITPITGIE